MWILMENEGLAGVIGSSAAPYLNQVADECGLATDYSAISHPSLPNYLALTGGSTFGVSDDGDPSTHPLSEPSIFSQVSAAGLQWRSFAESMPAPCETASAGLYAARHNPAVYYVGLGASCTANDVAMGPLTGGTFTGALAVGLPSFTFITPNLCDDMHSCPVADGDQWMSEFLPLVLDGPDYRAVHLEIFITFDEGTTADNVVPLLVIAPSIPAGARTATPYDHYSLLRTTEEQLGLGLLGNAASAASMAPFVDQG